MANRRSDSNRISTGRSRLATFLLLLMPGFMFLGLLAPGAVVVQEELEEEVASPIVFRNFQLPTRTPMLGDRVAIDAGISEVAAIRDMLAAGVKLIDRAKEALEIIDFEMQSKEEIVLDDGATEAQVVRELLDSTPSMDESVLIAETNNLLDDPRLNILPGPFNTRGERPDDDFAGEALVFNNPVPQPVEIPEPATGALFAFGLAGFAMSRRTVASPRS